MMTGTGNTRLEPHPQRDWSSRLGAEALAAEICRFWSSFGHFTLKVWIEPARGVWCVRSTLQGALWPPTPTSQEDESRDTAANEARGPIGHRDLCGRRGSRPVSRLATSPKSVSEGAGSGIGPF